MLKANAKYIILGVLVLMLIGAGYVNYRFSTSQREADMAVADVDAGVIASPASTDVAKATQTPGATTATTPATTPAASGGQLDTVLGNAGAAGFFASFRDERESVRDKEIEYLDSIITNENSDKESLKDAQDQKIELTRVMEKEMTIEGMLKAKGFTDAVVTLRTGSVNVVVNAKEITDAQAAQILDIVRRETGESAENIKIIPTG